MESAALERLDKCLMMALCVIYYEYPRIVECVRGVCKRTSLVFQFASLYVRKCKNIGKLILEKIFELKFKTLKTLT